jgi:hypothetical protein
VVISVLIANFNIITNISNELAIARLIRLIGCYPVPQYFPFVQNWMGMAPVFRLEGINCFRRVLSNKEYMNVLPIM